MVKVIIEGMSCAHCVKHVKDALIEVEGVASVNVDLATKTATIEGEIGDNEIREAIEDAGYDVVSIEA